MQHRRRLDPLSARDRGVLELERTWGSSHDGPPAKFAQAQASLGLTPQAYALVLSGLVNDSAAADFAPDVIATLRRTRPAALPREDPPIMSPASPAPAAHQVRLITVDGTEWLTKTFVGDANDQLQRLIHDEHIDSYEIVVEGTTRRRFLEPSTVSFTRDHIVALWVEAVPGG